MQNYANLEKPIVYKAAEESGAPQAGPLSGVDQRMPPTGGNRAQGLLERLLVRYPFPRKGGIKSLPPCQTLIRNNLTLSKVLAKLLATLLARI
jgi:hypothetical protein